MDIEDFDLIAEAHKVQSKRILENLGITINVTDMPEYKEYVNYYLGRNWLVRWYLRTFKRADVMDLKWQVQCALLAATLEKGDELIETDLPLATLDVMEHNGGHTE